MILYIFFLVVAVIAWVVVTVGWTLDAFDEERSPAVRYRPADPKKAKRARLAWLSFFLLPVYPIVALIALVVVPITIFRRLGRINQGTEDNE